MNKTISSLIVASCTLVATPLALACDPMHQGQPCDKAFAGMDANKDGTISKKEFEAFHNKHFKELDSNKDGKLTEDELQSAHPQMHEHGHGDALISKRFETSDLDHDGGLTREEAKNMPMLSQHFDEYDADKNGKVTQEELKAMMEEHRAEGSRGKGNNMKMQEKK